MWHKYKGKRATGNTHKLIFKKRSQNSNPMRSEVKQITTAIASHCLFSLVPESFSKTFNLFRKEVNRSSIDSSSGSWDPF
mmetsp:Transcript_41144/g.47439  ORF Transcript_41144/g.47439 Transcript_41144/m.47439 type:complete len:80 (-) Transcript_41144:900-1139(-)